jgi:UDP-N-acetylmuramoyl-tripeptide--D-alanyl-D-alanine ligase
MLQRDYYPLKNYFPDATFLGVSPEAPFQGFCHDSRHIQEGELFLALQGQTHHGYEFASKALAQGALAIVVDHSCPFPIQGPAIIVSDVMTAATEAAIYHRRHFPGMIYALTGTAGKTSTKEYFAQLTQQIYPSKGFYISLGNWNNTLGLIVNISRMPLIALPNLFELGISDFGDMDTLVDILRPEVVAITSIGEAHLEKLKNVQGVALEKEKIARYADRGLASEQAYPYLHQKYVAWKKVGSNVQAQLEFEGGLFKQRVELFDGKSILVYSNGFFHQQNFMLALSILQQQNTAELPHEIDRIMIKVPKGRGSLSYCSGLYIIDDTYNASLPSLRFLLAHLSLLSSEFPVGCLLSDFAELGPSESELLDEIFRAYPPVEGRLFYYYAGSDSKSWIKRGAVYIEKSHSGAIDCAQHARAHHIKMMAFKASRNSALEHMMHAFMQALQPV